MSASETVAASVIGLSHDGQGVADLGGRRVFVPGALPSEEILLRPKKRRRRYQEAELVDVVQPAPARVTPPCRYFGVCGGCALQHLDYPAQLEFKQRVVAEALARIGRVEPDEWLPTLSGRQWRYRRRARLGVKHVKGKGRVLVGFRERAAPLITDMAECPVLVEPMDRLPALLAEAVAGTSISDRIPQAEIAVGDDAGALVLRVLESPSARDREIFAELGRRLGIDVYLQTGGPDTIAPLAEAPRVLAYTLQPEGIRIEFAPGDFIQINAEVNQAMVAAVLDAAGIGSADRVLDLYSGVGNFSLPIARRAAEVLGVEGAGALAARAARNAELNGIANARFVAADLDEAGWPFFREPWDLLVLDPARGGAAQAVAAVDRMRPRRIVYVSCHPGTLARDAEVLVHDRGYRLRSARVADMFPHTHHVEALAVFDRDG